jgi:hypothetical protein
LCLFGDIEDPVGLHVSDPGTDADGHSVAVHIDNTSPVRRR